MPVRETAVRLMAYISVGTNVSMSDRQLQRKLKAITNAAPHEYIRNYRLAQARQLLESGERASEVAFAVGFTSQSYFTTCFKARFGVTPTEIRTVPRAGRVPETPAGSIRQNVAVPKTIGAPLIGALVRPA